MPAKKFRFVSPGVQIKEIDKSQLSALPEAVGPVVIGRTLRGPGMVPVTVNSYEEFVEKFGAPDRGAGSSDVWRNGNTTAPTYAAYAAEAYLRNSSPLTMVRLMGTQDQNASTSGNGEAGWKAAGGAYGLFISTTGSAAKGALAAIFYAASSSLAIELMGATGSSDDSSGDDLLIKSRGSDYEFKMKIGTDEFAFNFNKNSGKYIRKVFNTNPTLTNASITPNDSLKKYWLGETFETFLRETVPNKGKGELLGFVSKMASGSVDAGDFKGKQAAPGQTGWVIGQDLNPLTSSYTADKMTKLFRLVSSEGQGGDWEQNNVKVSVFDIKPPVNEYQKYGTFSVGIRKVNDIDANPEFVEVFTGCNLDPTSPGYVAARIGDRHLVWQEDEKRHIELGEYPNMSRYVRVEMNPVVEQGGLDPELLPFGFFGPPRFKKIEDIRSGSIASGILSGSLINGTSSFTGSVSFPSMKIRVSASEAGTLDLDQAFFGVVPNEGEDLPLPRLNEDYRDLARCKPQGVDSHVAGGLTEYSFVFSLDDVEVTGTPTTGLVAQWVSGSRHGGTSFTSLTSGSEDWTDLTDGSPATLKADTSYKDLLDAGFDRFTMPLFGGTDGLDITEREPFRNSLTAPSGASETSKQNYAVNSLYRAIDSIREPEVLNMNLLVLPGITNKAVTRYAIDMCENRADSLAIIDIEGGYKPSSESTESESSRLGSVKTTVTNIKNRSLNSSYACTYYPWVKVVDSQSGQPVWMPPSIVALGTMASSQENSELWFAPAGFNRGGLSVGSSGLSVVGVREKLTAKQRDSLYEVNINPIASFPSEGIVIFGQKTLQAVPSALDRINVRRLVLFLKKQISIISAGLLFEPNVEDTWNRFRRPVTSILESVRSRNGISDFRLVLDNTTTTAEEIDRNMMYAKLFIKPVYAIEFIGIDFVITNTGASFEDL